MLESKSRDYIGLEAVDLDRQKAVVLVSQTGIVALHELAAYLERFPAKSRLLPRHRVESILEGLRESRDAADTAIDTFEALLEQTEAKPVRTQRRGVVVDFAAYRAEVSR